MSDEWKLAQGLKNKNYGLAQGHIEAAERLEEQLTNLKKIKEEEKRKPHNVNCWYNENALKEYIQQCKNNNDPIVLNMYSMVFEIDDNNPSNIRFKLVDDDINRKLLDIDNESGENFTATIENGKIVYSELEKKEKSKYAHYMEENKMSVPIRVGKTVYVTDGNEINEYYEFSEQPDNTLTDEEIENVIESFLNNNPEFSKGNDREIVRENIDENEKNKHLVWDANIFRQYLIPGSQSKISNYPSGFYENYVDFRHNITRKEQLNEYKDYKGIAQNYERNCIEIYESIKKAYAELGEGHKFSTDKEIEEVEENEDNSNIQNTQNINNKESNTIENDIIEEMSDEDLDKFIELETLKQKENQQKIERLRKIKKAKELIALSKQQDKEISELESQIQKEGMEFDE